MKKAFSFIEKVKRVYLHTYIFFLALVNRYIVKNDRNGRILLISDGRIGDTILLQDFIHECSNYFHGYNIDLLICLKSSYMFYKECCIKNNGITLLNCSFPDKNESYCEDLIELIRFVREKRYEYVINPFPLNIGDKVVGCICGRNKITVRDYTKSTGGTLFRIYKKIAYTKTIDALPTEMEFLRYKKLLHYLGDKEYLTQQPVIKKFEEIQVLNLSSYCVLSIGASEGGKIYDMHNFAAIADYIIEKYNMPIVFLGDKKDSRYANSLSKIMKNKDIIDMTGKTNFKQWISIIRESALVVGNDSASIHISAAIGCKSVCIVGKWQYNRFYPYVLDFNYDSSPDAVFCIEKLKCENCGKIRKLMPRKYCRSTVYNEKSYYCLQLVSLEEVIKHIDNNLEKCRLSK